VKAGSGLWIGCDLNDSLPGGVAGGLTRGFGLCNYVLDAAMDGAVAQRKFGFARAASYMTCRQVILAILEACLMAGTCTSTLLSIGRGMYKYKHVGAVDTV
jgi:hypothetical protein